MAELRTQYPAAGGWANDPSVRKSEQEPPPPIHTSRSDSSPDSFRWGWRLGRITAGQLQLRHHCSWDLESNCCM